MPNVWAISQTQELLVQKIEAAGDSLFDIDIETDILKIQGNIAIIQIKGTLGFTPSLFNKLMGNNATSYEDIIAAINNANNTSEVEHIYLDIDSDGGVVRDSIWEASDAIFNSVKPVTSIATNLCCSAAYLLASQASEGITAKHALTNIGSIGVMLRTQNDNDEEVIILRSEHAENKNPDILEKPEQYLNIINRTEKHFIEHISRSLNLTSEKIVATFGSGATITAEEATERGMIKNIYNNNMFNKSKELEAKSPEIQVDVKALEAAAYGKGIQAERERVQELHAFAKNYNAPMACEKAILEGLQAKDILTEILEEQKRELTAKKIQKEVEAVHVQSTTDNALATEEQERAEILKQIGS